MAPKKEREGALASDPAVGRASLSVARAKQGATAPAGERTSPIRCHLLRPGRSRCWPNTTARTDLASPLPSSTLFPGAAVPRSPCSFPTADRDRGGAARLHPPEGGKRKQSPSSGACRCSTLWDGLRRKTADGASPEDRVETLPLAHELFIVMSMANLENLRLLAEFAKAFAREASPKRRRTRPSRSH
jgi:hypothetical protein